MAGSLVWAAMAAVAAVAAVAMDRGCPTWQLTVVAARCSFSPRLFEMKTKVILKFWWVGHFS